ncbi:programmed cell death protein 2-like [Haliotis rufescens]|uniref:programmed cell death protein 2-like n=1 Tax=Haliotis rufescens TaxID=6454 RepID=UPI00201FA871|nr:programmed cell death protein 2-like [Haliotis rufescens]
MAAPIRNVDLGFVADDFDPRLLTSRFFPSKVGGKPAWLSLSDLPPVLSCPTCGAPCVFLLQVYSPREEQTNTFHRTIFIFICRSPSCCAENHNGSFIVLRSQLAKENDFFSPRPPDEDHPDVEPEGSGNEGVALCVVCGSAAPKRCGKCHKVSYCSKHHQALHWKATHKKKCCKEEDDEVEIPNLLFPQAELVMEEEIQQKDAQAREKSESEKLKEYQDLLKTNTEIGAGLDKDELEKSAVSETEDDKQFAKFKARIATNPDQVLRYDRNGTPLWISASHKPQPSDIPPCSCGAPRQFEFQILPQLLGYLNVDSVGDSIDWGTLCIYTCFKSCDIGNKYQPEFLWKQDITGGNPGT